MGIDHNDPKKAFEAAALLRRTLGTCPESLFSFREIMKAPVGQLLFTDMLIQMHETGQGALVGEAISVWYGLTAWAESGFNVFEPTHSLVSGLILTEASSDVWNEAHFPFPSLVLRIPDGFIPLFTPEGQFWVNFIWVHRFKGGPLSEQSEQFWITWRFGSRASAVALYGNCPLFKLHESIGVFAETDTAMVAEDVVTSTQSMKLVFNFIMWLNANGRRCANADGRHGDTVVGRNSSVCSYPSVWIAGREVKLPTEFIQAARDVAFGGTSAQRKGWVLRMRHVVRGHWKQQVYGEHSKLRKQVWVEPYWRGPEGAAAWTHLYTTREAGET